MGGDDALVLFGAAKLIERGENEIVVIERLKPDPHLQARCDEECSSVEKAGSA
jgi:hypothetical protein